MSEAQPVMERVQGRHGSGTLYIVRGTNGPKVYYLVKKNNGKLYLKCTRNRRRGESRGPCRGSAVCNGKQVKEIVAHNHGGEDDEVRRLKTHMELRARAIREIDRPAKDILADAVTLLGEEANVSNVKAAQCIIRNARKALKKSSDRMTSRSCLTGPSTNAVAEDSCVISVIEIPHEDPSDNNGIDGCPMIEDQQAVNTIETTAVDPDHFMPPLTISAPPSFGHAPVTSMLQHTVTSASIAGCNQPPPTAYSTPARHESLHTSLSPDARSSIAFAEFVSSTLESIHDSDIKTELILNIVQLMMGAKRQDSAKQSQKDDAETSMDS